MYVDNAAELITEPEANVGLVTTGLGVFKNAYRG